ncbi:MAG: Ig-like domain-containing protein [Thermoanaerobaculia bacterium]
MRGWLAAILLILAMPLAAGEVATADLNIAGIALEVSREPVITGVDIPAYVQTVFGGRINDEAPPTPGLSAAAELTGPGLTEPISLLTKPGHRFALPALHDEGEYTLQNIRLVNDAGAFVAQAIPSFAIVQVTGVIQTRVEVRQLSVEELRQRGITIDDRNYEVYEYTFIFGVQGKEVFVPYPVIIDKRTHEVRVVQAPDPYKLPELGIERPPRFRPPRVAILELAPGGDDEEPTQPPRERGGARPTIPAAIVMPTGFGVLHQFFAVILQVGNTAPVGSSIRLDSITAQLTAPLALKLQKTMPAVALGQPVPVYDKVTGTTFLVAAAQGSAEWTLEALKAGTHSLSIEVNATYQNSGQPDFPLRGHVSTSLVVSDPRFHINFSHPDVVRKDEPYTSYAFISNLSPQAQHVRLDTSFIPPCTTGTFSPEFICRDGGDAITEKDIPAGDMVTVPYKLKSNLTGYVYAAAGAASDGDVLGVSVKLVMGVSQSGIPLSPATLVMPHYARYLPADFVDANMQLLGLGYSLATAPLNKLTAKFPRVIETDVFTRAQEIARAGQRVFIDRANPNVANVTENRDPIIHLSLDLLGNIERVDKLSVAPELSEWDELRRMEKAGRRAGAAIARQLELNSPTNTLDFVDAYVAATSHRAPFLFALVEGGSLSVQGIASQTSLAVTAEEESGWIRTLPYGELTRFGSGELALVGRWTEALRVRVVPSSASFTLHLIYPDTDDGRQLRTEISVSNATPGQPVTIDLERGNRTLMVSGATATPIVNAVPQTPLTLVGAAQDLYLDKGGHIVSLLFNRPIDGGDAATLRDRFALTTRVAAANYERTVRNDPATPGDSRVPGAAVQSDSKIIHVSFDKTLSTNATYTIGIDPIHDALVDTNTFTHNAVVPRIDNDAPGAILTGKVVRGDNTPYDKALVILDSGDVRQYDVGAADGRYMFEFVARDIDRKLYGDYILQGFADQKSARIEGAVRLPGAVHEVNIVFLGRGTAEGRVMYDDNVPLPNVLVTVGSTMFSEMHTGLTDASGFFSIADVPVGPLTFSVIDAEGRPTYAANHLANAGQVVKQDLIIYRREFPGTGTVRVIVRRSDIAEPDASRVAGAHVGVYTQGYSLTEGYTDSNGYFEFRKVPAGLVSILAADFGLTRESAGIEVDLAPDATIEHVLILPVRNDSDPLSANLSGTVFKDDPAAPSDPAKNTFVAGAIITLEGLPPITAGPDGTYVYPEIPLAYGGRRLWVFDPTTGRRGQFQVPTLLSGDNNHFSPTLRTNQGEGSGTLRVRLSDATGKPVSGYRVLVPGFPPTLFADKGSGVYELSVSVPRWQEVWAVPPGGSGTYGQQYAHGVMRIDFNGQTAILDLRLPGQGTVIAHSRLANACSTGICYSDAYGPATISYSVWDEAEQDTSVFTFRQEMPAGGGPVTFTKIPARQEMVVATVQNPAGFAAVDDVLLAYEGDVRTVYLDLSTLGDVTGSIYMHDRRTPAVGAVVRFEGGAVKYPAQITKVDGSFRFPGIPANTSFRIIAEFSSDGIYRTGYADARTPTGGGPVSGLLVIMREQSSVEGTVVDLDDQPVPLAHYWLRELAWPYREIGTAQEPLTADNSGKFVISNVFTGPFRVTARSPEVQETRGDYQGELAFEGVTSQLDVKVKIGGLGTGAISVTVIDPNVGLAPVENAEVALYRGTGRFDFTTTNANGVAFFDEVPVTADADYRIVAYAKGRGLGGQSEFFKFLRNETKQIRVTLDFKGTVDGFVTDPEGATVDEPVKGIPVTLSLNHTELTRDSTDSLGKFLFEGVPEGPISLAAFDLDSGRMAFSQAGLFISKSVPEQRNVHLELERTGDINVKAYLPTDSGAQGEPAPLIDVLVEARDYYRGLQGNNLDFKRMITRYGFNVTIKEIGGEYREVVLRGLTFAAGQTHKDIAVTFPSAGTVSVRVVGGADEAISDAKVNINGRTLYTPANGVVTLTGVAFGEVFVQASKGTVAASASGTLQSRSVPLAFELKLGSSATVRGYVEAEGGQGLPSVGTRVLMTASSSIIPGGSTRFETMTGADGFFTFTGVPVSTTRVTVKYYGPDDTTIGRELVNHLIPNGTTGVYTLPPATLDATPPRVLSIDPPANATNVSPGGAITVVFSESISTATLNNNFVDLIATDNSQDVQLAFVGSAQPDGRYIVRMTPPAPPAGQTFPLRSNVLYRLVLKSGMQDSTGNAMVATVGSSFTTVNYTEPAIVRVQPAETEPLPSNATFRVKFNKAIDVHSYEPGNGGTLVLEQLSSYKGTAIANVPIAYSIDVVDPTTLTVAPTGVAIAESSFYRLRIANTRDTQEPPNVQKDARSLEFFSYDLSKPVVEIVSPVGAGEKLVSGVPYLIKANITNADGSVATDVASVDWFDAAGNLYARDRSAPWEYTFVPDFNTSATFTIQASATDLSNNESADRATFTWEVAPNNAPADLAVTNVPEAVYPNQNVESRVTFTDEGVVVTVAARLKGLKTDGSTLDFNAGSAQAKRDTTSVPFPETKLNYKVPKETKEGEATVFVTVTDSIQKSATFSKPLTILADAIPPQVASIKPKAESRYAFNTTYDVEILAKDSETGIEKVELIYDPSKPAEILTAGATDANGFVTYRKTVLVPPKNADTRVHTVAKVYDYRNNVTEAAVDVIWERVDDPTVPAAYWITPLDGAALPTGLAGWTTTLRVQATDNVLVTQVKFESSALAAPVIATKKSGTTDQWESKVTLNMGSDPFVIKAIVSDGDPAHDVELPITIDPITPTVPQVFTPTFSIHAGNVDLYNDQSVVVRGNTRVSILVPVRFKNLMLVDGASFATLEETKVQIEVTDRLFIDADSFIDLNEAGYLGGNRRRSDNNFTNTSSNGRTLGGTAVGGPTSDSTAADGSYGGIGGEELSVTTNAIYGSITEPADFGTGGAGRPGGNFANIGDLGTNGGGALKLTGGTHSGLSRFVLAGTIRADGGNCAGSLWGCGSGGSVLLDARAVITGAKTRITANGGTDVPSSASAGGGGGRIALRARERLDVLDLSRTVQVRGGYNGDDASAPNTVNDVDGGSGTFFLMRPDSVNGELILSSFDDRHTNSFHRTRGTPLSGTLTFDKITIGPRALARFDNAYTLPEGVTPTVDTTATVIQPNQVPAITAVSFTPASGSNVVQGTEIAATYTAASPARVTRIRSVFSATATQANVQPANLPVTVAQTTLQVPVTDTATTGPATLKLVVTDLSGRTAETTVASYTVVANGAPVITRFDVTPPTQMYAGHTIDVDAAAIDDVKVKTLDLLTSSGSLTSDAPVLGGNTLARKFHVAIAKDAAPGTIVALKLTATDEHSISPDTSETKNVTLLSDTVAPTVTVTSPTEGIVLNEGAGNKFTIQITAIDAEVAIKTATALLDGVTHTLAQNGNVFSKTIDVPNVDGTEDVPKTITISVADYQNNVTTKIVNVLVKPLIDPNAPLLTWSCTSPNALYPANYDVKLRVFAKGANAANGIQSVVFTIDNNAPVTGTLVAQTTDFYETTFTIPGGTAAGKIYNVTVRATTVGGNDSVISSTFEVVSGIELLNTSSTIETSETGTEDRTYIVKTNGVLTIVGARTLKNLVILDGGKVIHRQSSTTKADALTVQRLYIACNGIIDADQLGLPKTTTVPGAGLASQSSGGSYIGRGGLFSDSNGTGQSGTTYGSIFRPELPGSGGYVGNASVTGGQGGGVVRVIASTSATIDGSITAKGGIANQWGSGSGGAVWITTQGMLAGGGSIIVRGAGDTSFLGSGGGGAVSLEYGTLSGELAKNVDTSGGRSTGGFHGASGSLLLKSADSTYGQLVIDNRTGNNTSAVTELPSFGIATVASANGSVATLTGPSYVGSWLKGHAVRVTGADGTVRGTWPIVNVTNDASIRLGTFAHVKTQDAQSYDGYIIYSDSGRDVYGTGAVKFFAARFDSGQWKYDSDTAFVNFTPAAGESIVAAFRKASYGIVSATPMTCPCTAIDGMPVMTLISGEILINQSPKPFGSDFLWSPFFDAHEMLIRPGSSYGVIAGNGGAAIELESGADVRAGDTLRGVYRLDEVTVRSGRVIVNDLLESTTPPAIASGASLISGNTAPVIDASRVAIVAGADGPVVTGSAGAIADSDTPLDVIVHNTTKARGGVPALQNLSNVVTSTVNGFSIRKLEGSPASWGSTGASSVDAIAAFGSLELRPAQANKDVVFGLAPNDTTRADSEPGLNGFRLKNDGTWQVLTNGILAVPDRNGGYVAGTLFRIEKSPLAIRWVVDGQLIYESTTNIAASLRFDLAMEDVDAEVRSIVYEPNGAAASARVAANGSFSVPIDGVPGDALTLTARDSHTFPLTTTKPIGEIGAIGVSSLTFDRNPIGGGRAGAGTLTLLSAAPQTGAIVRLQSSNAAVVVPATVTVTAGQTSRTFNLTTTPVAAQVDVTITATWGGSTSAQLVVIKDITAPVVTIQSPAADTPYNEGASNLIAVRATAIDDESGVLRAYATIDGADTELTKSASEANVWTGNVPSPSVDGGAIVTRDLVVTAIDRSDNSGSSAPVPLRIKPVVEGGDPVITWICGSEGAIYPAGGKAKLRVKAVPPSASNLVQKVELTINGLVYQAAAQSNDEWELLYDVPAATTDGAVFSVDALATAFGGGSASIHTSFIGVTDAFEITANTTIAAADTSLAARNVIVRGGTTTIVGPHTFRRLAVYAPATLVHQNAVADHTVRLDITADAVFVECGAKIDVAGRGFDMEKSYPGGTIPENGNGGSHIGIGGQLLPGLVASPFGSVYRPLEAGGGSDFSTQSEGRSGGGVVHIVTQSFTLDGALNANGAGDNQTNSRGGAGGSVWIRTSRITGIGAITASGGDAYWGAGGGGAISVEYTDAGSIVPRMTAAPGAHTSGSTANVAGPGSVYTRGPQAAYGTIRIDAGTILSDQPAQLSSFGKGVAQGSTSGATLVTTLTNIPAYFVDHWIEITNAAGTVKGIWRVASISGSSVTLAPNGSETIALLPGDGYQGIYRFDDVQLGGRTRLISADPIRTGTQTIDGNVILEQVAAKNLTINGTITHPDGGSLTLDVEETLHLKAGAKIDVSGHGYARNTSYPGATLPGSGVGGSHIGVSGQLSTNTLASSFGSVYRPREAGGGSQGNSDEGRSGGGVVRIKAATLIVDGDIKANGLGGGSSIARGAAGGSVWITAGRVTGTGSIEANGGSGVYGGGAGGSIAVEYTNATSTLPPLTVYPNATSRGDSTNGGGGTIYIKGPSATYGDLRLEHGTVIPGQATELPALGSGTALAGSSGATLVVSRTNIPAYFEGHWVEIANASGTVKGTWSIVSIAGSTLTLTSDANVTAGDSWRGIYLFDSIFTTGTHRLESSDAIRATVQQTVTGKLTTERVNARNLTVGANATLMAKQGVALEIAVDEQLRVETSGTIDLAGKGYLMEVSYPGASIPGNGTGGSHMGVGGYLDGLRGTTFGSVVGPREFGAGSDFSTPSEGRSGGGALSITAGSLVVNGLIRANGDGDGSTNSRGGAGGSILIRTDAISGSGIIEANGGDAYWGPGGGGALSIAYGGGTLPQLRARPGNKLQPTNTTRPGSGTIYTFAPGATWGSLRVDNGGITTSEPTALQGLGSGIAQSGSTGATLATDRAAAIPAFFAGHWVEISTSASTVKGMWHIASIDGVTVTLAPNGSETINIATGDRWRGVYRFDGLILRGSKLISGDAIVTTTAVDKDATSTLEINEAPAFPIRSQITVTRVNGIDSVSAPAGGVTDPHPPIALIATNVRTGQKFNGTAVANGSFNVAVTGASGDTFTLRATDSHAYLPLTSETVSVNGTIAPPQLASVVIQPSAVPAGENAIGTVRLVDAARSDGAVVTLTSSSEFATVPASVSIAAGSDSAQFVIATTASASNLNATITATAANTKSATVSIAAVSGQLVQVAVDAPTVTGGTSVNGTATIGAPAPAGGALVTLSASDTQLASVPATVIVPQGSTSASFTITTKRVSAESSVTISGIYGATQTAGLSLTACATLGTVAPPSSAPVTVIVLDDALPGGATATGDGVFTTTQAASGTKSIALTGGPGAHAYSVSGISMSAGHTDTLVAYALINPCNPPKQILMTWTSGTTTYRASWGESRIGTDPHTRVGAVPQGGSWVRLEVLARPLGVSQKTISALSLQTFGGEAWFDRVGVTTCSLPQLAQIVPDPSEVVWFDDVPPANAELAGTWEWSTAQVASGTVSMRRPPAAGWHQHYFRGTTETLPLKAGDVIFTYVLLDPCDPPLEVMLQFRTTPDSEFNYRGYWGDNLIPFGTDGTANRVRIGALPATGEWVRLEIPVSLLGLDNKTLDSMAFTFWDGTGYFDRVGVLRQVNLALGKTATQSSTQNATNNASRAVDGITSGANATAPVAITQSSAQPWWQVDLGNVQPIESIQLWNRTDATSTLSNLWVFVSDTPISTTTVDATRALTEVSSYRYVLGAGSQLPFRIDRPGRFVRVQLEGTNALQLAEVQVWAPLAARAMNVAGGRSNAVTQVSTAGSAGPERAVNGTTNPAKASAETIAETASAAEAWWQIDLGSVQPLAAIDVWNRLDCCSTNLTNFWLFVSDVPFDTQTVAGTLAQTGVSAWFHGTSVLPGYRFDVARRGRYVRVQLAGTGALYLPEVQVWTRGTPLYPLARTGTTQ